MGDKEQVPARAIFVQGSLWVWSATSRKPGSSSRWGTSTSRLPHGPSRLGEPLGSLLLLISSYILLLISATSCSLPRLALRDCSVSSVFLEFTVLLALCPTGFLADRAASGSALACCHTGY